MAASGIVSGLVGAMYIASSPAVGFYEACTLQADGKTLIIDNTVVWIMAKDKSKLVPEVDGVAITVDYEIEIGRLVFKSSIAGGTLYKLSGEYIPTTQVGGIYEWGLDTKINLNDKTTFGDEWEQKEKGVSSWSASFKSYWVDESMFGVTGNTLPIIWRFFTDIDNWNCWIGYGHLDGLKQANKVTGLMEEEGSITGDGKIYFMDSKIEP